MATLKEAIEEMWNYEEEWDFSGDWALPDFGKMVAGLWRAPDYGARSQGARGSSRSGTGSRY